MKLLANILTFGLSAKVRRLRHDLFVANERAAKYLTQLQEG